MPSHLNRVLNARTRSPVVDETSIDIFSELLAAKLKRRFCTLPAIRHSEPKRTMAPLSCQKSCRPFRACCCAPSSAAPGQAEAALQHDCHAKLGNTAINRSTCLARSATGRTIWTRSATGGAGMRWP